MPHLCSQGPLEPDSSDEMEIEVDVEVASSSEGSSDSLLDDVPYWDFDKSCIAHMKRADLKQLQLH